MIQKKADRISVGLFFDVKLFISQIFNYFAQK